MLRTVLAALMGRSSEPLTLPAQAVPEDLQNLLRPADAETLTNSKELNLKLEIAAAPSLALPGMKAAGRGRDAPTSLMQAEVSPFAQTSTLARTNQGAEITYKLSESVTPQGGTPLLLDVFALTLRPTAQGLSFTCSIAGTAQPLDAKSAIKALRLIDSFAIKRLQGQTFAPITETEKVFGPSRALAALSTKRQQHLLREPPSGGQLPTGTAQRPVRP